MQVQTAWMPWHPWAKEAHTVQTVRNLPGRKPPPDFGPMPILMEVPIPPPGQRTGHYRKLLTEMISGKLALISADPEAISNTTDHLSRAIKAAGMRNDFFARGSKLEGRIWLECRKDMK